MINKSRHLYRIPVKMRIGANPIQFSGALIIFKSTIRSESGLSGGIQLRSGQSSGARKRISIRELHMVKDKLVNIRLEIPDVVTSGAKVDDPKRVIRPKSLVDKIEYKLIRSAHPISIA